MKRLPLTAKQWQFLELLQAKTALRKYAPTEEELVDGQIAKTRSAVQYYLAILEKKGMIRRYPPNHWRNIILTTIAKNALKENVRI